MTEDLKAWAAAVREAPEDDLVRGAFADWLEEQGLPEAAVSQRDWSAAKAVLKDLATRANLSVSVLTATMREVEARQSWGHCYYQRDIGSDAMALIGPEKCWDAWAVYDGRVDLAVRFRTGGRRAYPGSPFRCAC